MQQTVTAYKTIDNRLSTTKKIVWMYQKKTAKRTLYGFLWHGWSGVFTILWGCSYWHFVCLIVPQNDRK